MKVVITGAGGLVGQHLAAHFAARHDGVVLALGRADLDITDRAAVFKLIEAERPQLIFNCAVIGVDECERDESRARAVNVRGPQNLAEAAHLADAEVVHFSTNYVFDGGSKDRRPYTQADAPRPVNVYGRTKLAGEQSVRAAAARSHVVRTSWVYGPGKDNFLGTAYAALRSGRRVRAIRDTWASTTYVRDLVGRVGDILARGHYGTYHVVNGGVCSYHDFARECARLAGLSVDEAGELIERVSEAETERAAARPAYTPMRCRLSEELGLPPLRPWPDALAAYVSEDFPNPKLP